MAFFDKLGNTISAKSRDVAQKAREMADIAKLNSQISGEEDIISATYQHIGMLYYQQNRESAAPEYQELFARLAAANEHIEQMKNEIQSIRNIRSCPSCGAEMPFSAQFCPSCGAKTSPPQAAAPQPKCAKCGALLERDAQFCPACGTKVEEAPQAEPPQAPPEIGNCPRCGAQVDAQTVFCPACGQRIQQEDAE